MTDTKFCSGCGKETDAGMQFCPYCGKVVAGTDADARQKEMASEFQTVMKESRKAWLSFALGIYAMPIIIIAIIALIDAGNTASTIWNNADFQNWNAAHNQSITLDELKNYVTYLGVIALSSGILALISFFLIYKGQKRMIAFVCCLIAAFLCFWSIFGLFIGVLVAWMILGAKDLFDDETESIKL
jgi:hypothetical protein